MKWAKALIILAILVGSLIPAGMNLAVGNTSKVETYPPLPNTTKTTPEQKLAERIINIVERLHNITEKLLQDIALPENSSVIKHYNLAEDYRRKAEAAYQDGDYAGAVTEGLLAMHQYRYVLKKFGEAREGVLVSMERMRGYFEAAQRTIAAADRVNLNTSKAKELLSKTREAYLQVVKDIKEKNIEKAKEDLEKARELKKQLDIELRELRKELALAHSDKLVNAFLARGERAMRLVEKVISRANETGRDVSELQERLNAFRALYEQVKGLADQGNYTAALGLIEENRQTVKEFYKALRFIHDKLRKRLGPRKVKGHTLRLHWAFSPGLRGSW